jgi:leader peptidase (prepilin peptidase)/N-methyltransferase
MNEVFAILLDAHVLPWVAAVFGAIAGSFANVVIYRLPARVLWGWRQEAHGMLELEHANDPAPQGPADGRSRCPGCGSAIQARDNVPVLSWLVLLGRARCCGMRISPRYPLVEAGMAALWGLLVVLYGPTWFTAAAILGTWLLLVAALIDADTTFLFDVLTLPLLWLGLAVAALGGPVSASDALLGAAVGYGVPLVFSKVYGAIRGLEIVLGEGDLKLLAAIGAWGGIAAALGALVLGAVLTLLAIIVAMALKGRGVASGLLPFGPGLIAAGWLLIFVVPAHGAFRVLAL